MAVARSVVKRIISSCLMNKSDKGNHTIVTSPDREENLSNIHTSN